MNKVDRCVQSPFHCAVFPTLGAQQVKGYYRTDTVLPGPGIHEHTIYVSVEAVETLARKEGWVPRDLALQYKREILDAQEEIERLKGELAEANRHLDAIDVIESRDFRARKKPGRKPEKAAA